MKPIFIAAAILCAGFLLPAAAAAHKVTVFAWVEADTVHTESKFSGGKRVQGGKIEVFDHNGQPVAQGLTDDRGRFDFNRPQGARGLRIVLTAGMGHTNHWTVTAEEMGVAAPPATAAPAPAGPPSTTGAAGLDVAAIERIVDRRLEKKLAPLRAQLANPSWGLRDIVSGVGYILGLMGLASYLHHRKKDQT